MKIKVSGKSYGAACDPEVFSVPVEQNWPEPTFVKTGNGTRWTYEGDPVLARQISEHLRDIGHKYMESKDQISRKTGRALLRDAVLIHGSIPRRPREPLV